MGFMRMAGRERWAVAAVVVVFAGCDDSTGPEGGARFAIEVNDERFVVHVESASQIAELEARLASGEQGVVNGEVEAGDGGFNAPWSWHMVPSTVHTADVAMEVCDGWPGFVEEELAYWLNTVKRFCPWGARVVERLR